MIRLGLKRYVELFRNGSVMVTGMRGSGKDLLMSNIAVRNGSYISNIRYSPEDGYIPLDFNAIDIGNNVDDLISGDVKPYSYPYPDGVDVYISDTSVYFPSYDFKRLNQKYGRLPIFLALSRHLGECNVHCNAQNLDRIWDKLREHADTYIYCRWSKVIGPFVVQCLTIYDKAESCQARVKPFNLPKPSILAPAEVKQAYEVSKQVFEQNYGSVKTDILIYPMRSNYDSRAFKKILLGEHNEQNP